VREAGGWVFIQRPTTMPAPQLSMSLSDRVVPGNPPRPRAPAVGDLDYDHGYIKLRTCATLQHIQTCFLLGARSSALLDY
jgi:hypothetical protein